MRDGEDVLSLTEQLIAIESHQDAIGREAEIGQFLVGWFRDRGIDAELRPGRCATRSLRGSWTASCGRAT